MTRHVAAGVLVALLAATGIGRSLLYLAYADELLPVPEGLSVVVAGIAAVEIAAHVVVAVALAARWRWAAIGAWVLSGAMLMAIVPVSGTALASWSLTPFGYFRTDAALIATAALHVLALAGYVALVLLAVRIAREREGHKENA